MVIFELDHIVEQRTRCYLREYRLEGHCFVRAIVMESSNRCLLSQSEVHREYRKVAKERPEKHNILPSPSFSTIEVGIFCVLFSNDAAPLVTEDEDIEDFHY
jgi:hypothetical protein